MGVSQEKATSRADKRVSHSRAPSGLRAPSRVVWEAKQWDNRNQPTEMSKLHKCHTFIYIHQIICLLRIVCVSFTIDYFFFLFLLIIFSRISVCIYNYIGIRVQKFDLLKVLGKRIKLKHNNYLYWKQKGFFNLFSISTFIFHSYAMYL